MQAGSVCVSVIHRTMTWTTGSLMCVHDFMRAYTHGGCAHWKSQYSIFDSETLWLIMIMSSIVISASVLKFYITVVVGESKGFCPNISLIYYLCFIWHFVVPVEWECFPMGNLGSFFPRKASCNRVVLPAQHVGSFCVSVIQQSLTLCCFWAIRRWVL